MYRFTVLVLLIALAPQAAYCRGSRGGSHHSRSTGDVSVHGYYRKNGTYVQPYMRSHPDGTTSDNFSHVGNVNPYTGAPGTKTDGDVGQLTGNDTITSAPDGNDPFAALRSIEVGKETDQQRAEAPPSFWLKRDEGMMKLFGMTGATAEDKDALSASLDAATTYAGTVGDPSRTDDIVRYVVSQFYEGTGTPESAQIRLSILQVEQNQKIIELLQQLLNAKK